MLDEPIDPAAKDPIIRENAQRYGQCAAKVITLMEDIKQCND